MNLAATTRCTLPLVHLTLILCLGVGAADIAKEEMTMNEVADAAEDSSRSLVASGIEKFTLELFKETVREAGPGMNVATSPFSVWALLVLISEGSRGNTKKELDAVLGLPVERRHTIAGYRAIEKALKVHSPLVTVESVKAIFCDTNRPLQRDFETTAEQLYECPTVSTDFREPLRATGTINDWVNQTTHGRIPKLVFEEDLRDAQLVVANAIYFQGRWSVPFDENLTREEPFYDEDGKVIGTAHMMNSRGAYAFVADPKLNANVIEIPYGKEKRLSMMVLLPRYGSTVNELLAKLPGRNLSEVTDDLEKSRVEYLGDGVDLKLPRFETNSDYVMNVVLTRMGIKDVFAEAAADLSGISPHRVYLSRVIHKTVVLVNEEGTVAASATAGSISNKSPQPTFYANRPFVYFIYEKTSKTIVFAGKVSAPSR